MEYDETTGLPVSEGIPVSCQTCEKKSDTLMEKNFLAGGWYHSWRRKDFYGYFLGLYCEDCIPEKKRYYEDDGLLVSEAEARDY